jgi:hypothetical protein
VLRTLWRESIAFRRAVAALTLVIAKQAVYLASNIPQTASLPSDDIDKLAVAHSNEELRIYKPQIDVGDPGLSFEGAANVGAEVWVQHATLTGSSVRFAALAPRGSARAVYAAGDADTNVTSKDCRTSLTIARAEDSSVPQMLKLWQQGTNREDQHFRQLIVSSPETALSVEVSTNSPPPGQAPCPRVLTMGNAVIPVPAGPVDLLVPPNEPITLIFSAIDPNQTLFSEKKDTFDGLSLGDGDLKADGFDAVSTSTQKTPLLHVVAHKGTEGITLHDLKLGAEEVSLSVGEDRERADAWANGKKYPVFNLVDKIQKNPVLGFFLAAVLIPGLWKWIQKSCFPRNDEDAAKKDRVVSESEKS